MEDKPTTKEEFKTEIFNLLEIVNPNNVLSDALDKFNIEELSILWWWLQKSRSVCV